MSKKSYSKVLNDLSALKTSEEDTVVEPVAPEEPVMPVEPVAQGEIDNDVPPVEDDVIVPAKTVTDNRGATVVKPVVSTKFPSTVQSSAVKSVEVEDTRVSQFKTLVATYLNFNDGDISRTREDAERAGVLFTSTLKFIIENPTQGVLDEAYKFFKTNQSKILEPKYALSGIVNMPKQVGERLSCIYTMFKMMTNQVNTINTDIFKELLGKSFPSDKVEKLLLYYTSKTQR